MKRNSIIFFGFLVGIILSAVLVNSCHKSSIPGEYSGPCGSEHRPSIVAGNNVDPMSKATHTNFIVNGDANVGWKIECKNVCTAQHSTVSVNISTNDLYGITIEATILYGILRERPITLSKVNTSGLVYYSGYDDFGIKDYYGDSPGEFTLIVSMNFPSANNHWSDDSMYVSNNVTSLNLSAWYREPK